MEKFKAPALAKGLDIIDLIRTNGPLSFNEIQSYTSDNPASLSRYLHTLMAKDYLFKSTQQKYALGLKLMALSDTKSLWPKIKGHMSPFMEEINDQFDITILLIAYTGDTYNVIDKVIAENNLGMMANGTTRQNTLKSMWSNLLYSTDLNLITKETIRDHHDEDFNISELITFTETHGYVRYYSETSKIIRYGFPIWYNGHVIATVGAGSFIQNLTDASQNQLIQIIQNAIEKLEATLN